MELYTYCSIILDKHFCLFVAVVGFCEGQPGWRVPKYISRNFCVDFFFANVAVF